MAPTDGVFHCNEHHRNTTELSEPLVGEDIRKCNRECSLYYKRKPCFLWLCVRPWEGIPVCQVVWFWSNVLLPLNSNFGRLVSVGLIIKHAEDSHTIQTTEPGKKNSRHWCNYPWLWCAVCFLLNLKTYLFIIHVFALLCEADIGRCRKELDASIQDMSEGYNISHFCTMGKSGLTCAAWYLFAGHLLFYIALFAALRRGKPNFNRDRRPNSGSNVFFFLLQTLANLCI